MTLKVILLSLALQIPLITMDWTQVTSSPPAVPANAATIECDEPRTGNISSDGSLYFLFDNTVERDVSFSTCFSATDTTLRLYEEANFIGDGLQYAATNNCDGDGCQDHSVFLKCPTLTETFTMRSLDVGQYVLRLGSRRWHSEPYDVRVLCNVNAPQTGNLVDMGDTTTSSTTTGPSNLVDMGGNPTMLLAACQGDCDSDSDCLPGLVCWHRELDFGSLPPECFGEPRYALYDYCGAPDGSTTSTTTATTTSKKHGKEKNKAKGEKATTFVFEVSDAVIAVFCVSNAILLAVLLCCVCRAKGANREQYGKVMAQTDVETDDENGQFV